MRLLTSFCLHLWNLWMETALCQENVVWIDNVFACFCFENIIWSKISFTSFGVVSETSKMKKKTRAVPALAGGWAIRALLRDRLWIKVLSFDHCFHYQEIAGYSRSIHIGRLPDARQHPDYYISWVQDSLVESTCSFPLFQSLFGRVFRITIYTLESCWFPGLESHSTDLVNPFKTVCMLRGWVRRPQETLVSRSVVYGIFTYMFHTSQPNVLKYIVICIRYGPLPVTVTTRSITFLGLGDPNLNLHFPPLLGGGHTQNIPYCTWMVLVVLEHI